MPELFLSLDGVDGCGKSTQCRLLADWLRGQGHTVTTCADPGGTPLGEQLRQLLLHHRPRLDLLTEALLFMASRAQLTRDIIRPSLDAGQIVLCDRFLLATVVYQGHAGGLDPDRLWQLGLFATGGLEPTRTVVLNLPLALAQKRRGRPADQIESREPEFHRRVHAGFLAEAHARPVRIHVINAAGSPEEVQQALRADLAPLLQVASGGRPA
jgi:dTMP kinase